MGINPSTLLRSWLGCFHSMLDSPFRERHGAIGRESGDVEKLSVRKEGDDSRCFSPERGWEAKSSQAQKLQLEGETVWGWDRVGQEKMGLSWGKREGK